MSRHKSSELPRPFHRVHNSNAPFGLIGDRRRMKIARVTMEECNFNDGQRQPTHHNDLSSRGVVFQLDVRNSSVSLKEYLRMLEVL